MRWIFFVTLALLFFPLKAFAWGSEGHKIVCMIAWAELTSQARQGVIAVLRNDPDFRESDAGGSFARSCVWADKIRGNPRYNWAKPHHFVNVPRGTRSVSREKHCHVQRGCVLSAMARYASTIKNPQASQGQKAEALKFLAHFVGDVHQPLHVSHSDDLGGNKIQVTFFGRSSTLHKVWDTAIIRKTDKNWSDLAGLLHAAITNSERATWRGDTSERWATESYLIAVSTSYREWNGGWNFGQGYQRRHWLEVAEQLKKAGVRLAEVLNR